MNGSILQLITFDSGSMSETFLNTYLANVEKGQVYNVENVLKHNVFSIELVSMELSNSSNHVPKYADTLFQFSLEYSQILSVFFPNKRKGAIRQQRELL